VKIELQPAFILHSRPYRETSQLWELLTRDYGRVAAVARGTRGRGAARKGGMQAFTPLLISLHGRGDGLFTLGGREQDGSPMGLAGQALACGFYANEVIMRLCARADPMPEVFLLYRNVISSLARNAIAPDRVLRLFEKQLLQFLGFGMQLLQCADTGAAVSGKSRYHYVHDYGPVEALQAGQSGVVISGASLLALSAGSWDSDAIDRELKKLMRSVMARHLGDRALMSRCLLNGTRP